MINNHKWDNVSAKDKLEFVKGIMNVTYTNCISREDWEIMCRFLLDEIQSCNETLDGYAKMLHEQSLIIDDLKKARKEVGIS